jgi:ABC-type lipoprotein export system ATPase subunit
VAVICELQAARADQTIVIITHDATVAGIASRVLHIPDGRIVVHTARPEHPPARSFSGASGRGYTTP